MACIIIREAGKPDRRFVIRSPELIVGRGKEADLALPHITVSREHAKISCLEGAFFIENTSGQDTMMVNEKPRNRAELNTKDTIQIGKFSLIFFGNNLNPMEQFFDGKALDDYPVYSRTSTSNRKDATFQMSPSMVKKMISSGNLIRNAKISSAKNEWTPGDKMLSFGKGGEVPVDGWFTGGTVAEIRWNGNDHFIKRTSSFTSIKVNGDKVKDEQILNNGDKLHVGKSEFQYTTS